jgi:hypothetical protein
MESSFHLFCPVLFIPINGGQIIDDYLTSYHVPLRSLEGQCTKFMFIYRVNKNISKNHNDSTEIHNMSELHIWGLSHSPYAECT